MAHTQIYSRIHPFSSLGSFLFSFSSLFHFFFTPLSNNVSQKGLGSDLNVKGSTSEHLRQTSDHFHIFCMPLPQDRTQRDPYEISKAFTFHQINHSSQICSINQITFQVSTSGFLAESHFINSVICENEVDYSITRVLKQNPLRFACKLRKANNSNIRK